MQFYKWSAVGVCNKPMVNHVFRSQFGHEDAFKALCNPSFYWGGKNGENSRIEYCSSCASLAPIAEEIEQAKERARIVKLELQRPAALEEINNILSAMQIDDLLMLLRELKR